MFNSSFYHWVVSIQNKLSKLFFQITVLVYSLPGQTEGERKVVFLKEDWERRRVHGEASKKRPIRDL